MAFTVNDVRKYFEYDNPTNFRQDWLKLSEPERAEIRKGIENGTLTY